MVVSRAHRLTKAEEFSIWLSDADTILAQDIVTYYGICAVVGVIEGGWIGNTMVCYLRAMGY